MSILFGKNAEKAITIILVLFIIFAAGNTLLTDNAANGFFAELMGNLPFSRPIAGVISNITNTKNIPLVNTSNVLRDILILIAMSCIRRPVVNIISGIIIKVPENLDYAAVQVYMNSPIYKMKKTLITVLLAPILAFMASEILADLVNSTEEKFGGIGIAALCLLVFGISLLLFTLGIRGMSQGNVIVWIIVIALIGELMSTVCLIAASIWIYIAMYNGTLEQSFTAVLPIFIMFLLFQGVVENIGKVIK